MKRNRDQPTWSPALPVNEAIPDWTMPVAESTYALRVDVLSDMLDEVFRCLLFEF